MKWLWISSSSAYNSYEGGKSTVADPDRPTSIVMIKKTIYQTKHDYTTTILILYILGK